VSTGPQVQPRLLRTLTLADLMLYGTIIIGLLAPTPIFGVLSERGQGHVVTAVLVAMVAMLLTGISYGRMARVYPSAGSAFTYVAQEIHPAIGYVVGWSIGLDYILGPAICIIWCAEQSHELMRGIPIYAWKIIYAASLTSLNIRAIRSSARINRIMTAAIGAVVIVTFLAAVRYILSHPHGAAGFFWRPFYDPQTFNYDRVVGSTSIAVLTYLGFDAISTLSEEALNPRRNIILATVLTCLAIGIISAAEVYVAQLVWPASEPFPNLDTAYVWAAARMWSPLFSIVGCTLIINAFGAGLAAHLGAARLLYAMGRSNALPQRFFGALDAKHRIPRNNVILLGVIGLLGASTLSYDLAVEMVNFGALLAFMGVNAAAFLRYFARARDKTAWNLFPPLLGFIICLTLWWNLGGPAKVVGSMWMVLGMAFGTWRSRGFRKTLSFEPVE
jgi:putrescine importer